MTPQLKIANEYHKCGLQRRGLLSGAGREHKLLFNSTGLMANMKYNSKTSLNNDIYEIGHSRLLAQSISVVISLLVAISTAFLIGWALIFPPL